MGCSDDPVGGDLTVTATPGELTVDDVCIPSCAGGDSVTVNVAYAAAKTAQQGSVQLSQYRVDYALPGVSGVPFFAGPTEYNLEPGKGQSADLLVVGEAQRAFVDQATGGQSLTGTATLELAGYDFDNRQVFVSTTFNVTFGAGPGLGTGLGTPDAGGD
jgi:hypothetical protein